MKRLALIAHDAKKPDLAEWADTHKALLRRHQLVCTGTTGGVLKKRCPDLSIRTVKSGPLGGDQQIGAMIAEGTINAVIFFIDPLSPMPHDVDVKALMRLAVVYDVPLVMSASAATILARSDFLDA